LICNQNYIKTHFNYWSRAQIVFSIFAGQLVSGSLINLTTPLS